MKILADLEEAKKILTDSKKKVREGIDGMRDFHKELAKDDKDLKKIKKDTISDLQMTELNLKRDNAEFKNLKKEIDKISSEYIKGDIVRLPESLGDHKFEITEVGSSHYKGKILEEGDIKTHKVEKSKLDNSSATTIHKEKVGRVAKLIPFLDKFIKIL